MLAIVTKGCGGGWGAQIPCPEGGCATNARLNEQGGGKVVATALRSRG